MEHGDQRGILIHFLRAQPQRWIEHKQRMAAAFDVSFNRSDRSRQIIPLRSADNQDCAILRNLGDR
ncbi:hypothetical protein D3C83_207230 [compost metagenome]